MVSSEPRVSLPGDDFDSLFSEPEVDVGIAAGVEVAVGGRHEMEAAIDAWAMADGDVVSALVFVEISSTSPRRETPNPKQRPLTGLVSERGRRATLSAMTSRTATLGAAIVALFLLHAGYLAGVAEDAFITFRFARNWVDGFGIVWNPGEVPVEGYTNFLWLVLSAGFQSLGIDPVRGAQWAGVAASLATLVITWRFGVVLLGWSPIGALLPCAFLAVSGPFAAWAGAGLETNAFGALLLGGLFLVLLGFREQRQRDLMLGFGALLLAMLTRPEGILVYGLVVFVLLLAGAGAGRSAAATLRLLAPAVSATLSVFAVYFAWRWSYFGYPLPNTFYAKTGGGTEQYLRGASYVLQFGLHYIVPWLPALLLLRFWQRGVGAHETEVSGGVRLPIVAAAAVFMAYGLAIVWLGGDYMAMYRFFVPVLPFLYLTLARPFVAQRFVDPAAGAVSHRAAVAALLGVALLGTGFHSTPLEAEWLTAPTQMHGNWRGVQTERWHVARLSLIGDFFARRTAPNEPSLATDAIGVIGWKLGITVYGVHGIVDPAIAHAGPGGRPLGRGWAGHEKSDWARLFAHKPTWIMLSRSLAASSDAGMGFSPEVEAAILKEYELEAVWQEDVLNGEAGYFVFLERRDL